MTLPDLRPGIDFTVLWLAGYYDGPMSGLCEMDGETFWFQSLTDEDTPVRNRRYLAFPLTADEAQDERERHRLFREYVGTHMDPIDGTLDRPAHGAEHPRDDWSRFYDLPLPDRSYTDRDPVFAFYRRPSPHRRRSRSIRYFQRRAS